MGDVVDVASFLARVELQLDDVEPDDLAQLFAEAQVTKMSLQIRIRNAVKGTKMTAKWGAKMGARMGASKGVSGAQAAAGRPEAFRAPQREI